MRNALIFIIVLVSLLCFSSLRLFAATEKPEKYWFFLRDKGPIEAQQRLRKSGTLLTARAITRRAKVYPQNALLDSTDLPVYAGYVRSLQQAGIETVCKSRWLNAVSGWATPSQVEQVRNADYVRQIIKTLHGRRRPLPETDELFKSGNVNNSYSLDYGLSLPQNELIRVPQVHDMGFFGQGVLIAVLDNGFHLAHSAFRNLSVINTYDFINNDSNVDNQAGQDVTSQNVHGTYILSILAGYNPDHLIGPAFGADFLLAKTEDDRGETAVEEDYWIAGAEWADSLGADIISTSLGYIDWYTTEDMDGETAPVTIAADMAVSKGIVVVASAGNEGDATWRIIGAPADGKQVISVGAVDRYGVIAGFSSRGPTADGRIKPDVVAMGVSNYAVAVNTEGYSNVSGTSASCPMVAGVVALMLSAHPGLTPAQVREALLHTADRYPTPDNTFGYGLVNAVDAVNYWGASLRPNADEKQAACYPNPLCFTNNSRLKFVIDLAAEARLKIEIYNVTGQKVSTVCDEIRPPGIQQHFFWDGFNVSGNRMNSGIYFCRIAVGSREQTIKITLLK